MMNSVERSNFDPVTEKLLQSASGQQLVSNWQSGTQQREWIARQVNACILFNGLMLVGTAVISAIAAWVLSRTAIGSFDLLGDTSQDLASLFYYSPRSGPTTSDASSLRMLTVVPITLIVIAFVLAVLFVVGWVTRRIPGHRTTLVALDCNAVADAMMQLTSADVPDDEALTIAKQGVITSRVREWLSESAGRSERGQPVFNNASPRDGDLGVMEILLQLSSDQSVEQRVQAWRTIAEHFAEVAQNRAIFLRQFLPPLTTICCGILAWIAISGTLGYLWRTFGSMINSLN